MHQRIEGWMDGHLHFVPWPWYILHILCPSTADICEGGCWMTLHNDFFASLAPTISNFFYSLVSYCINEGRESEKREAGSAQQAKDEILKTILWLFFGSFCMYNHVTTKSLVNRHRIQAISIHVSNSKALDFATFSKFSWASDFRTASAFSKIFTTFTALYVVSRLRFIGVSPKFS